MSLRCAVGLNLTAANRVIMMDLWYNGPLEYQAFARVHRIGQTKEVHAVRIIALETFDTRVLDLQKKKADEVGKVYKDDEHIDDPGEDVTWADVRRAFEDWVD